MRPPLQNDMVRALARADYVPVGHTKESIHKLSLFNLFYLFFCSRAI